MSADEVLDILTAAGADLSIDNGKLRIRAPATVLTPEVREAIRQHRTDVVRLAGWRLLGQCPVHRRWLAYPEQMAGCCFWCTDATHTCVCCAQERN